MSQVGWIKLHRSILDNKLWQEKREYSRLEAWLDILLMVNHADGKVIIDGRSIEVRMGNKVTSIKHLAERWSWSRKKVTNFLKLLQDDGAIEYKSTSKYTLLSVVNWAIYQSQAEEKHIKSTREEHQENITGTSEEQQKHTNKNVKNVKNEKNVKNKTYGDFFESIWALYPIKRGKGSVSETQKAKLYAIGYDEIKRAIERYSKENAKKDLTYWKHGSTFFNSGYMDYLDANYSQDQPDGYYKNYDCEEGESL